MGASVLEAGGLSELANGKWRTYTTHDGLPADNVSSILRDGSGTLWIGTTGGLAFLQAVFVPDGLVGGGSDRVCTESRGSARHYSPRQRSFRGARHGISRPISYASVVVGEVIQGESLLRMPAINRSAMTFFALQPLVQLPRPLIGARPSVAEAGVMTKR